MEAIVRDTVLLDRQLEAQSKALEHVVAEADERIHSIRQKMEDAREQTENANAGGGGAAADKDGYEDAVKNLDVHMWSPYCYVTNAI